MGTETPGLDNSADPYRWFFMEMNKAAAILDAGRVIVNANQQLAKIL